MRSEWKLKNRYFNAVLYPEDENYENYFKNILNKYKEVTWIDHDRDIDEEENYKKKHTHILFKVGENARSVNSIAKEIGILPNYIQGTKKIPFLRYLIHLDNPEKTQYSIDEVHGELKEELKKQIKKNYDEEIKIAEITTQILNRNIKTTEDLLLYGINNHVTEQIRKFYFILSKLLQDKNYEDKEKERKIKENEYKRLWTRTSIRNREKVVENTTFRKNFKINRRIIKKYWQKNKK